MLPSWRKSYTNQLKINKTSGCISHVYTLTLKLSFVIKVLRTDLIFCLFSNPSKSEPSYMQTPSFKMASDKLIHREYREAEFKDRLWQVMAEQLRIGDGRY